MPARPPPWLFPISRAITATALRGVVRAAGSVVGLPTPVVAATQRVLNFLQPGEAGAHAFLSEDWVAAAREIREEYRDRVSIKPPPVRVNYAVTEAPFGRGTIYAHSDTTSGEVEFELSHVPDADVTVTLPYDAARALLVDADVNGALQLFSSGRISIEGDVSKLFALTTANVDPVALEVAERVRRITA